MKPTRIHIFGASGSGTTTLGEYLGREMNLPHFDSDNYYWKKTDPPFVEKNSIPERQRLLLSDLNKSESWVLSGSLDSWSEPFMPLFTLAVFLYVPTETRIERIIRREESRHGSRILSGGDMHKLHVEFIEWARQYDRGSTSGRNLKRHEEWIKTLKCPILRLENQPTEAASKAIEDHLQGV